MKSEMDMAAKSPVSWRQVLPPLLMLPLFVAAWDVTSLVYWIVCGIAAFASLLGLLWNLLRRQRRNPDEPGVSLLQANLRPLLCIAIFVAAAGTGYLVELAAGHHARELAASLQRACKDHGRCDPAPAGWNVVGKLARSGYGHWTFTYVTNPARSKFGLWVHKRNENEQCVHGGSAVPLSEVNSVDCNNDPQVRSSSF